MEICYCKADICYCRVEVLRWVENAWVGGNVILYCGNLHSRSESLPLGGKMSPVEWKMHACGGKTLLGGNVLLQSGNGNDASAT